MTSSREMFCLFVLACFVVLLVVPVPAGAGVVATGGVYVLLDTGAIYQLMFPASGQADFVTNVPFALTEPVYFLTVSSSDFGLVTEGGHLWWYYKGGQGWVDYGYPMGQMTPALNTTWGEIKAQHR